MPFSITTRLLGFLSGGLFIVALLAAGFAYRQTSKLQDRAVTIQALQTDKRQLRASRDQAVTVANERGLALSARDVLIADQSSSIDRLAARAQEGRTVYLQGIARADQKARANEDAARSLILPPPAVPATPDAKCEAARSLILQEFRNVR